MYASLYGNIDTWNVVLSAMGHAAKVDATVMALDVKLDGVPDVDWKAKKWYYVYIYM